MEKRPLVKAHNLLCEAAAELIGVEKSLAEGRKRLAGLDDQIAIQTSDGNWNYDPYHHGMANGLILARATITGEEPKFLSAPRKWGNERLMNEQAGSGIVAEGVRDHGKNATCDRAVTENRKNPLRSN